VLSTSLDDSELAALLQGAQTIEADGGGLKVAQLSSGDFLKLFRRKPLLSSALWAPPAARFAKNAQRLLTLGIAAPPIEALLQLPRGQSAVRYQPLPGQTLRTRWAQLGAGERAEEIYRFGAFLGALHEKGVYFRSLHLGNVLHLPDGSLGLIDLSDMSISRRALPACKRKRNLKHMLRYKEDSRFLLQQHTDHWLDGYAKSSGSAAAQRLKAALAVDAQLPSSATAR